MAQALSHGNVHVLGTYVVLGYAHTTNGPYITYGLLYGPKPKGCGPTNGLYHAYGPYVWPAQIVQGPTNVAML